MNRLEMFKRVPLIEMAHFWIQSIDNPFHAMSNAHYWESMRMSNIIPTKYDEDKFITIGQFKELPHKEIVSKVREVNEGRKDIETHIAVYGEFLSFLDLIETNLESLPETHYFYQLLLFYERKSYGSKREDGAQND